MSVFTWCVLCFSLYSLVDEAPPRLQMHALRLLVNLSCDDVTIPALLAAQVSFNAFLYPA